MTAIRGSDRLSACSRRAVKSKIGEVFFCSACYDKIADEEVTLSCRCLSQREEDHHTSTVVQAHICFVEE